jgi:uncharacterized repeat protein (TIGR02543 family)
VVVAAFSDSGLTTQIGQDTDAGKYHYAGGENHFYEWELAVPGGVTEVWFGAKFGEAAAFEPQGYLAAVPEKGLTNIALPTLVTVTFNSNGGTAVDDQLIAFGGTVTKPSGVTKPNTAESSHMDGWYTDPAFAAGTQWDFDTGVVTSAIILYARWNYAVSLHLNGGTYLGIVPGSMSITIPDGGALAESEFPTLLISRTGYILNGWYQTSDLSGAAYDISTPVTEQFDLYAKWTPEAPQIELGEGEIDWPASITLSKGQGETDTLTVPAGYTVTSWTIDGKTLRADADGSLVWNGWDSDWPSGAGVADYAGSSLPLASSTRGALGAPYATTGSHPVWVYYTNSQTDHPFQQIIDLIIIE